VGIKKDFFWGFLGCFLLVACAGASFPYRHYPLDLENEKLLGAEAKDDLPLTTCLGVSGNRYPCMVVKTDEFYALKGDYLKTKEALEACQKGAPPSP
jgi:hypothetical protein